MTLIQALFTIGNVIVLPFWALMILLPRWHWTQHIISSPLIIFPPTLCYVLLLGNALASAVPVQFTPDLAGIMALLATTGGATAAWLHLLTFDLFVGRWVYLERSKQNANAPITSVLLLFVFLVGPLGFLLYLLTCKLERRPLTS